MLKGRLYMPAVDTNRASRASGKAVDDVADNNTQLNKGKARVMCEDGCGPFNL